MTKEWIERGESGPTLVASGARTSSTAPFSILDGLSPPPRASSCGPRWRVLPGAARLTLALVLLALAFRLGMIYMASGDEGRVSPEGGTVGADRVVSAVASVAVGDGCGASVPAGAAQPVGAATACASARTYEPQSPAVDGGAATIRSLSVTPVVDDTLPPGAFAVSGLQTAEATENASAAKPVRQRAEQKRSAGRKADKKADKKPDKKTVARDAASRRDHDVDIIAAIVGATRPAR